MYRWLRDNLPWTKKGGYTHARGKKLNDAFGEGWEADFKDAKWDARLVEVKAWVVRERRYPSSRKTPEGEMSMRQWLRDNLPGNKMYTPARWKKLNDAFGEGWEAEFKTGSPGHLEAKWDARLLEVKAWVVVEKGDFPRNGRRASEEERSMYQWLYHNLPGRQSHTPDRWKKLNDAFGEDWEADLLRRKRPREA